MISEKYIVHMDMDAFFASVEQRDNPDYRGKPVVVGADPKTGKGRGVVSTCSYEARKFGIHSAMPISIAYRKCPSAIFLGVDMEKYCYVSGQIFDILNNFTPRVQPVSVDEAFLDISQTYRLFETPLGTCRAIKDRVKKETGLTASVGLAPTKMAAKIASGLKKPDGLVEVKKEELLNFLWPLGVGELWGVGEKTKIALNEAGIKTIGDLAKRSKQALITMFGKNGEWFWQVAQGIDDRQVESTGEAKSISNETTFEKDTTDKALIMHTLAGLCEQVSSRLRDAGLKSRTITLKIRLEGFQTYTRSRTIGEPTNFPEVLIREIRSLYDNFKMQGRRLRLVGVKAANFSYADEKSLFVDKENVKKENVYCAVDKIRHKFGPGVIHTAASSR